MTPIPLPPPERDPFEGLVLDQSFVRAAVINEDAVHAAGVRLVHRNRLAVVRAKVAGAGAPELTRRSVVVCGLALVTLVAGLALVGPGWAAVSSAFGHDEPASKHAVVGGAGSWTSSWPAPAPATGAEANEANEANEASTDNDASTANEAGGRPGTSATSAGPVLVDGQLVDPFRDPFAAPRG